METHEMKNYTCKISDNAHNYGYLIGFSKSFKITLENKINKAKGDWNCEHAGYLDLAVPYRCKGNFEYFRNGTSRKVFNKSWSTYSFDWGHLGNRYGVCKGIVDRFTGLIKDLEKYGLNNSAQRNWYTGLCHAPAR